MAKGPRVSAIPQKRLALAVAAALMPFTQGTQAQTAPNTLPTGGQVTAGTASISSPGGSKLQIDQASEKAILQWDSFSIGSGAWVNFTQPSASAIALNRVLGNNPSEIFGRLSANGQVFLSNPSGVLFAPGASVDVGALFATTLAITDSDFLAGRYNFYNPGGAGAVVNQGSITANGYAALAGPQVRNDGLIVARAGTVALAAGDRVALDMVGDGLISVSVEQAAMNASAINTGTIEANGGTVLLTARSANALLDTVVNNSGIIRANSLVERNGEIVLDGGSAGVVSETGTLQAPGGSVTVAGDKVAIDGTAVIDTSAETGGGRVQVGGKASGTFVGADASIRADATVAGDGGQVTISSRDATRVYGSVTARGAGGGKGGSVETSGGYLELAQAPDVGDGGTWLIDPYNIQVVSGSGVVNNTGGTTFTPTGDDSQIGSTLIVNQLNAGANVIIDTGGAGSPGTQPGNLTVSASIVKTTNNAAGLTLNAANDLAINAGISLNAGAFNANAGRDMTVTSTVNASNMNVVVSGALSLNATTQDAALNANGGQTISAASLALHAQNNRRALVQNTTGNQAVVVGDGGIDLSVIGGSGVAQISSNRPGNTFTPGTQTVQTTGTLNVVGGSTTINPISTNSGVFQSQTGKQTVTAANIVLQGAASGNNAGAFISTNGAQNGGGSEQEINIVNPTGGTIAITGGGVGLANRAGISSSGNQTINGNADIILTGGASGIGTNAATATTPANSNNAAFIAANQQSTQQQTIHAGSITLNAGSGGTDTSATITSAHQEILVTGDVRLRGSDGNAGDSNGARIGASGSNATDLHLTARDVVLTGGAAASGAALGSSNNTPPPDNNIRIEASRDVILNVGSGNGVRIGTNSEADTPASGNISVTAGRDIQLDGGVVQSAAIRTTGNLTLQAGGSITETSRGFVLANALNAVAGAAANLGGPNEVAALNASSVGNFTLLNSAALDVQALNAGSVALTNSGSVTVSGSWNSFGPTNVNVAGAMTVTGTLQTTGDQTISAASLAVTGGNGRSASLSQVGAGVQSIAVTGGSIDVQALSGGGNASINAASVQNVSLVNGDHINVDGAFGLASLGTSPGGAQTLSATGTGRNAITVGSAGALGPSNIAGPLKQSVTAGLAGQSGSITIVGSSGQNALSGFVTNPGVGGTQTITTSGQISITGGAAAAQGFNFPAGIFHNGTGTQTINAAGIALVGGNAGNGNAALINSSGGGVPANAGDQVITVAGGNIAIAAGSVGSGNRAGIISSGNQTITGNPEIVITGGAGGLGAASNNTSNGAFISANTAGRVQTINAGNITLNAGADGSDTFATINGASQVINATGDVRLNGGGGSGSANGARIGGPGGGSTSLALNAANVVLTGGSTTGVGLGSSILGAAQPNTITVNTTGDVMLNSGSGAGARIGSGQNGIAGGDIAINAGGSIGLNGVAASTSIRTTGNVTLKAGGSVSEAPNGAILANGLTLTANGSATLGGANQIASLNVPLVTVPPGINVPGVTGNLTLNNSGPLAVTSLRTGGTLSLTNAGAITLSASGTQDVRISSVGGQEISADALIVHAQDGRAASIANTSGNQSIAIGSGGIDLSVANGQGVAQVANNRGALTNGTQTVQTAGALNVVGGSGVVAGNVNSGVFQMQTGKQTVNAQNIALQAATAPVNNGGALILNTNTGGLPAGDQEINVAGGVISITGGGIGFANRAGIQTNGNQTITGNADIVLTGGSSGNGLNSNNSSNAAFISANQASKTQTINAHNITLTAGSGGTDTFAAITSNTQTITATGDVRITGGSNSGDSNGARIGAPGSTTVGSNITLSAHDIVLTGGTSSSGAAIGLSGNSGDLPSTIKITASGDVVLNSGSGSGSRIGAPSGSAGAGNIEINATHIALNGVANPTVIRSTGNVTLNATGSITEAANGAVLANTLSAIAATTANLSGPNQVAVFNATSGGDVLFNNTGALQVTALSAFGDATLTNAGSIALTGPWNSSGAFITATGAGSDLDVTNSVFAGGAMTLNVAGGVNVLVAGGPFVGGLFANDTQTIHAGSISVTSLDGGFATINQFGNGTQSITVNGGSIDLQTLGAGGDASMQAGGSQVINVVNGDHLSVNALGGGTASMHVLSGSQTVSLTGDGRNAIAVGSGGALGASSLVAPIQSITAGASGEQGSIMIIGSQALGTGLFTSVSTGTSQTVSTSGALSLIGDAGFAQIVASGGQRISADSLHLAAQNFGNAGLFNNGGDQRIAVGAGGIALDGGSGFVSITNSPGFAPPGGTPPPPLGTQSIETSGTLSLLAGTGGGRGIFQNQSATQTVSAGSITLGAADSGSNGTAFIVSSAGADQIIAADGNISVTAGGGGLSNRAGISAGRNQTITSNADIVVTGGAGGSGSQAAGTQNSANIGSAPGRQQTISARSITVNAGGGNDASATITGTTQVINLTEDVHINGSAGTGDVNGARIGGAGSGSTNLTLNARDVILSAGAANGVGLGSSVVVVQPNTINVHATRDVIVNAGTGALAGARIGSSRAGLAGGDITVSAGRDIALNGTVQASTIRTTGNVTLQADGEIGESGNGFIIANGLATTSGGSTLLGGPNQVAIFNATSGGDVLLNNTGVLDVTGLSALGDATLDNVGNVTISGPWTAGGTTSITVHSDLLIGAPMSSRDVVLTATSGSIQETVGGSIDADSLTTSSVGDTTLDGDNSVSSFSASSVNGTVGLTNTGPLTVTTPIDTLTIAVNGDLNLTHSINATNLVLRSATGNITVGGATALAPTFIYASGSLSVAAAGAVIVRGSDCTAGAASVLFSDGPVDIHAGSVSLLGGASPYAPAIVSGRLVSIATMRDLQVQGGSGFYSSALIFSGTNIDLSVGGALRIDGGSGEGSFGRIQTATTEGEIRIAFPNASSGNYFVDGFEGKIKHGQDGLFTGLKPAKVGDTLELEYGGE